MDRSLSKLGNGRFCCPLHTHRNAHKHTCTQETLKHTNRTQKPTQSRIMLEVCVTDFVVLNGDESCVLKSIPTYLFFSISLFEKIKKVLLTEINAFVMFFQGTCIKILICFSKILNICWPSRQFQRLCDLFVSHGKLMVLLFFSKLP